MAIILVIIIAIAIASSQSKQRRCPMIHRKSGQGGSGPSIYMRSLLGWPRLGWLKMVRMTLTYFKLH